MKLYVLYRSAPGTGKQRPDFFSKRAALLSFLRSLERTAIETRITFINDGEVSEHLTSVMARFGEVLTLPGIGNSPSYRQALGLIDRLGIDDADLTYLAEDDYLYRPEAFPTLCAAAEEIPEADYFSLYDHRDRYTASDDADGGRSRMFLAGGWHWRTVESSCMTFGARTAALRADSWIHWMGTRTQWPDDRGIWRACLGLGAHRTVSAIAASTVVARDELVWRDVIKQAVRRNRARGVLVSPVPSLATHAELELLSPAVDWEHVAAEALDWKPESAEASGA